VRFSLARDHETQKRAMRFPLCTQGSRSWIALETGMPADVHLLVKTSRDSRSRGWRSPSAPRLANGG